MAWTFHHINVPSSDVRGDAAFLSDVVGLKKGNWTYPETHADLHHDEDGLAYFGTHNFGLHVVRVVPAFASERGFVHNPTVGGHCAINIRDLPAFMDRARGAGVPLTDAGTYAMSGTHQSYVFDPSANMIEVNETVEPFPADRAGVQDDAASVAIRGLIVPAHDVGASTAFFRDIVGLGDAEAGTNAATFRGEESRLIVASPDGQGFGTLNPTLMGAFLLGIDDLSAVRARLDAGGHIAEMRENDPLLNAPVLYTLTPSARLIGLMQRP